MSQTLEPARTMTPRRDQLARMAARVPVSGLALVLAVAACARFYRLAHKPLWIDEVITWQRAGLPSGKLIENALINHHLPTYFLMLAPLAHLSDPQFWLRVPSAVFGVACAGLVAVIGRRLAGRLAGTLAGLTMALSPVQIEFGQEARSYTLMMALILLALWGLVALSQELGAASASPMLRPARRAWAAFVFGSAGAMLVLGDSLPWLLAAWVGFLAVQARAGGARRVLWRRWLLANAAVLACALPAYAWLAATVHGQIATAFLWIPPLTLHWVWTDMATIYLLRVANAISLELLPARGLVLAGAAAGLALLAASCLGVWRLRRAPGPLAVMLAAVLALPVLVLAVSAVQPILIPRYLLWSGAPLAVLAGVGLSAIRPALRRPVLASLGVAMLLNLVPYYTTETKYRWDLAAHALAARLHPGDQILLSDWLGNQMLQAYLPAADAPVLARTTNDVGRAEAAYTAGHRVWAIYGAAGQGPERPLHEFEARLAPFGKPVLRMAAGGQIRVLLFDHLPAGPTIACTIRRRPSRVRFAFLLRPFPTVC